MKAGAGEEEEDVNAAAALPHAVAPVGAPSIYFCGGKRYVYAAVAPRSLMEATARRKRTSMRLLRCRTRWRPWEIQACIAAAASEACIAAATPRCLWETTGRRENTDTHNQAPCTPR